MDLPFITPHHMISYCRNRSICDIILSMKRLRLFIIFISISLISGCGSNTKAYDEPPAEPVITASVPEPEKKEEIITQPPVVTQSAEEIDTSVNIIMVGDILLHTPVEEATKNDETGIYDFDFIFDNSKDKISSADIAIANEEVIIGGEELKVSGYPAFNAPYEIGDALYDAGFDVICHATNHALDKGKKGIINCLDYWRSAHPDMIVTGIYENEADASYESIPVIEKNGIRIAILNYTYGTNGISPPADMPYAVSMLDKERVISQLDIAEREADFTIVCPHWGIEYNLGISSDQEKWALLFIEHGADAVIGTHPHVIEPLKIIDDVPVYYSLGNFVNWTSGTGKGVANRMVGAMADITISRKSDGSVSIDECLVRNYVCHVESGDENVRVYPLEEYSDELALKNEIIKQDSSFSRQYCESLVESVYSE